MKLKFNYYMSTRIIFGASELNILSTTPYSPGKKALVAISSGNSMKNMVILIGSGDI